MGADLQGGETKGVSISAGCRFRSLTGDGWEPRGDEAWGNLGNRLLNGWRRAMTGLPAVTVRRLILQIAFTLE